MKNLPFSQREKIYSQLVNRKNNKKVLLTSVIRMESCGKYYKPHLASWYLIMQTWPNRLFCTWNYLIYSFLFRIVSMNFRSFSELKILKGR